METNTDLSRLPETVLCYNPTTFEPIIITDSQQQSFSVPLDISDTRTKVSDVSKHPYDCVGLILAFFKNEEAPFYSTGFLVDHNKVLTAAHSVFMKIRLNNPIADKLYFLPIVDG